MSDAPPNRPGRGTVARGATVVLALALASAWLVPAGPVDENRALNSFPEVTASGLVSAQVFRQVDTALVDHLGAKSAAVTLVGTAVARVGLSASPLVVRASDGEPLYSGDFTLPCQTKLATSGFSTAVEAEKQLLASRGMYFMFAIVPDKSSIARPGVPAQSAALTVCAVTQQRYLEAAAESGDALVTAWSEFGAAQADGLRLYIRGDTHWNYVGASLFTTLVLKRLIADGEAPSTLLDSARIVEGRPYELEGGLYRFMGEKRTDLLTPLATERPGVATTYDSQQQADGTLVRRWQSTSNSSASPLVSGRTLVIGDSMFQYNAELLAPYFEDLTFVHMQNAADPGSLARVAGYDRVIVQQVQRTIPIEFDKIAAANWF